MKQLLCEVDEGCVNGGGRQSVFIWSVFDKEAVEIMQSTSGKNEIQFQFPLLGM